jgi:hypothetical protein
MIRDISMRILAGLAALGISFAVDSPASAETRVALVIGNANYANVARLGNPISDAQTVAAALRKVGFTTVTVQSDLGVMAMRQALQNFGALAASSDVALVYYAGHGMEAGGVNYLIPVDAKLATSRDLEFEAVSLDLVLHAVEGAHRLKLVVLDACRNNPFAAQMQSDNRAIGRGLARIEPEGDTLVAYAAKAGTTANDGTTGNSPFATAFARDIALPGIDVRILLGKVRDDVLQATNRQQEPFTYGSLGGDQFYFVPPTSGTTVASLSPQTVPAVDQKAMELQVWNDVKDSGDVGQIQSYLDQYPKGTFAGVARARIAALGKAQSQTSQNTPSSNIQVASLSPQSAQPKTYPRIGAQSLNPPPRFKWPLESFTIVQQNKYHNGATTETETTHFRNFGAESARIENGTAVVDNGQQFFSYFANTGEAIVSASIPLDYMERYDRATFGKSGQQWVAATLSVDGWTPTGNHESHLGESCTVYQLLSRDLSKQLTCITDDYIQLHLTRYNKDGSVFVEATTTSISRGDAGPESDWEIPPGAKITYK